MRLTRRDPFLCVTGALQARLRLPGKEQDYAPLNRNQRPQNSGLPVFQLTGTNITGCYELLGGRQHGRKVIELPVSLQNPRPGDKQGGTALDLFLWQQAHPALHLHPLLLLEGPQKLGFHQQRRPRCISRHKRVLDRLLDQSLAGIPRARSPVQRSQLLSADTRL